jgi:hypothetical protein
LEIQPQSERLEQRSYQTDCLYGYIYSPPVNAQSLGALWKEGSMNNPETAYDWQQPYTAAIWETDKLLMDGRIYKALSAVEGRRLSPVEVGSDEDRALTEADAGIQGLITESTEKPV